MNLEIKITGSGTPGQIITALKSVIDSLHEVVDVETVIGWEDQTLYTEIHKKYPIGYQVVSGNDIHPDMDGTFCVYSLEQSKAMKGNDDKWQIVPIYEGDIEDPTIMY